MSVMSLDGAREAGVDPDKLRRALGLLQEWVNDGTLPAAAAVVSRGGWIVGEAYVGVAHRAQSRMADERTVWSVASVTKPFAATAVMLLVEEGRFSLDDPLHRLLPEFMDAPETAFNRRAVTLRHVLAHCSGLPGFSEDNTDLRRAHRPLPDFVRSFGRQPLFFEPGTAHLYSNPGILMAAEVVGRALAGTLRQEVDAPEVNRLHPFVHERILARLGMVDSTLLPAHDWDERIAWVERTGQEGKDYEGANSAYYRSLGIPWGGLFTTPRDLVQFVDLFLPAAGGRQRIGAAGSGTGEAGGAQLVSRATATAMTSVQFAPPDAPADVAANQRDSGARTPPFKAVEWGIGWDVKGSKRPHSSGDLTSAQTISHTGATGTMVWADPGADVACVMLTNRTAASGWTTEQPRRALFSNAVMAAVG